MFYTTCDFAGGGAWAPDGEHVTFFAPDPVEALLAVNDELKNGNRLMQSGLFQEALEERLGRAADAAEERVLDVLLPPAREVSFHDMKPTDTATRQKFRKMLREGQLDDREIEIELEMVSAKATRMRTVAKQGVFFKDRATATEILNQTEKILGLG